MKPFPHHAALTPALPSSCCPHSCPSLIMMPSLLPFPHHAALTPALPSSCCPHSCPSLIMLPSLLPFPHHAALTPAQQIFNYRISSARIVVENAFGRLKARWWRLLKQNEINVVNIPAVVHSCCILHNMCEI